MLVRRQMTRASSAASMARALRGSESSSGLLDEFS